MFRNLFFSLILIMLSLAACAQPEPTAAPTAAELPPEPVVEAATRPALQPAPVAEEQLTAEAAEAKSVEPQFEPTTEPVSTSVPEAADLVTAEMLANMTYSSEFTADGTATLVDGEYREQAAPGSATETIVWLSNHIAYGELNGLPVAAAVLVSDPGGSGTFYSLHLVSLVDGQPRELASTALGDRVDVETVTVDDEQVTVEMVVAGPDDALCCPTQQVVQIYELQDGELVKTADEIVGSAAEAPADGIVNRLWGWQERSQDGGDAGLDIDTDNYTLIFHEDGTYQYTADCNRGGGLYTTGSEGDISMQPSVESLADCGPDSHSEAMKDGLREARTYRRENGSLVLVWGNGTTEDSFIDRGTAVPEAGALGISAGQISLDTQGLYETWTAVEIPARPVDASGPPGPRGLPEHIEIYFDYDDPALREGGAIMYIIPVDAYIELWELAGYDSTASGIDAIYELAREIPSPPPTSGVPVLPVEETSGFNDLAAQLAASAAGPQSAAQTGYRFIGRFAQSPNPLTNQNMRYITQGFTNDGKYLVAFFAPIRTDELPDTGGEVAGETMEAFNADSASALDAEARRLNSLAPDAWEPDLAAYDALLNSLRIEEMVSAGLQSSTWQWTGKVTDPNSGEQIVNDLQEEYTAEYGADLVLSAVADCNLGLSDYELVDTGMTGGLRAQPPTSALAECGPESYSRQFATMLGAAQNYRLLPGGTEMILSAPDGDYVMHDAALSAGDEEGAAGPDENQNKNNTETGSTDDLVAAGITLDVTGLAQTYTWEVRPETPIPAAPGGQGYPRHVLLTFDGEDPDEVLANDGRRLYIFPAQPYIDLYEEAGRGVVGEQVARLEELIDSAQGRLATPEGWMPLLPPPDSLMERWAQFRDYDFSDGMGVRYVSDSPYRQSIGIWSNDTNGYYYQGLTGDGRYYVSLWWPVTSAALPDDASSASSDVQEMANNPETHARYIQETKNALNALPPDAFAPPISQIDVMVGSLAIGE